MLGLVGDGVLGLAGGWLLVLRSGGGILAEFCIRVLGMGMGMGYGGLLRHGVLGSGVYVFCRKLKRRLERTS